MSVLCHDRALKKPRYELADIFERYLDRFLSSHKLSVLQYKVVSAIRWCRTEKLGHHLWKCSHCGYERPEYNSCRNRHCPKCQVKNKFQWMSDRLEELLPVPYYHAVFTMPHSLNTLALYNKAVIYDIFFKAVSRALHTFAADPHYLGAQMGFIGILHTWGQTLCQHIHLHLIVPGGGISNDGSRWVNLPYKKKFLFPVLAVSKRVRKNFAELITKAYRDGRLVFPGRLKYLEHGPTFDVFINKVAWQNWNCYSKKPFAGPEEVVEYMARYTHRVAISNGRLLDISGGKIRFKYKKYKNRKVYRRTLELNSDEFIRRFLLHVLPRGFKRIRHYGFLSAGCRKDDIASKKWTQSYAHFLYSSASYSAGLWYPSVA